MSENNLPAKIKRQRGDISKKTPPVPRSYYSLQDAVNYANYDYSSVPLTIGDIVHYAAAELVELFTPALSKLCLVLVDKRKDITGCASSLYDRPVQFPDMLVLSKEDCIEIETYGKTKQSDFNTGFTYSKGTLRCTHSAGSGWVWRTIVGTLSRSIGTAERGSEALPTQMQRSLKSSKSLSTSGQINPSLEMEGFNRRLEIVKHYPEPFELNHTNVLIACEALGYIVQRIEDNAKRNDANNNPQNTHKIISNDSGNVFGNSQPGCGIETHNSALICEIGGKSDQNEIKSEGNDDKNKQQKKEGKDEDHIEAQVESINLGSGFISENEVLALIGVARSTLNLMQKPESKYHDPDFPKKKKITPRRVGYVRSEIMKWIETRASKS